MYTYYAFSTVSLPFPRFLKKSLTRLQITQFLVGGSLAASYLFIKLPELPSWPTSTDEARAQLTQAASSFEAGVNALRTEGARCLPNPGQRAATIINCVYLVPLSALLFLSFAAALLQVLTCSSPPPSLLPRRIAPSPSHSLPLRVVLHQDLPEVAEGGQGQGGGGQEAGLDAGRAPSFSLLSSQQSHTPVSHLLCSIPPCRYLALSSPPHLSLSLSPHSSHFATLSSA